MPCPIFNGGTKKSCSSRPFSVPTDRVSSSARSRRHYCRALRQRGVTPERMLVDAKRVIEQTIDGDDVPIAERAVESCIRHYYRAD